MVSEDPPAVGARIAPGVIEIDTLLGGWHRVTAGYLIEGSAPVLVETGSQSSVPVLLSALEALGIGPSDLAGVAVTHIHLDHAGGVGDVARAFPSATIYVHPKGARHLADPSRLVSSASRVYGSLLDSLYGRLDPTPPDRIRVLEDGDEITVSPGRALRAVDSPGHAKHHVGLHDSESGVLFAGDAVGVRLPDAGVLRPSTPPPDFNLDQALESLRRFAERRPTGLALAHYGLLSDPDALLAEADATLRAWADTAEQAFREGRDIAAALAERFDADMANVAPAEREKLEVMNGVHSNAAGMRRWLETRGGTGSSLTNALDALEIPSDEALIATKWWPLLRSSAHLERTVGQRLQRLHGRPITLYQIHQPYSRSSIESQMQAMARLIDVGAIRHAGVSNFSLSQMREAHRALKAHGHPLVSNQVRYHLLDRHIESNGLLAAAEDLGISIIAYSPLAQGLLTGKFHSGLTPEGLRRLNPRFRDESLNRIRPLIEVMTAMAQHYGVTVSEVALNWTVMRPDSRIFAIPGATRVSQAAQNVGAMEFVLSSSDRQELDHVSDAVSAH